MSYQPENHRIIFYFVAVGLVVGGCAPSVQQARRVCPGAQTVTESLSRLRLRSENALSFKAGGQCRLQYYAEGKKHTENFSVKLWVNPPCEIYLQGDVAFDPKAIILGSNEEEFWLAMKPKEVSSYWWGRWAEQNGEGALKLDPKLLLEAFGVLAGGNKESWLLSREEGSDVLAETDGPGLSRKIYIDNCSYRVWKIVRIDADGKNAAITKLDRYKELSEDFSVPTVIEIVSRGWDGSEDSLRITLDSAKSAQFSNKQKSRLFNRPGTRGFKHIYKVVNGDIIEQ